MPDTRPRRTFAVISHPDAGKSTLTEALALHARVITEAGAAGADLPGLDDRSGVQQELLGQRRLAGVRVGNDREGAATGNFLLKGHC